MGGTIWILPMLLEACFLFGCARESIIVEMPGRLQAVIEK